MSQKQRDDKQKTSYPWTARQRRQKVSSRQTRKKARK